MTNVAHATQLLFCGTDLLCENLGWGGVVGWAPYKGPNLLTKPGTSSESQGNENTVYIYIYSKHFNAALNILRQCTFLNN